MMNFRTLLSGTTPLTGDRSRRGDETDAVRFLRRRSQRGIALVITLILLAVITTLAIAFLALTQRETGAVDAMSRTTDAEMAADSALERAKAEILAVYPARNTDVLNNGPHTIGPDMFVSVCCQDYRPSANFGRGTVVRYNREIPDQRLTNIYDAAPPVFVDTNRPTQPGPRGPLDDRFYVNVNRNLSFEETGYVTNTIDTPINRTGSGPGGFDVEFADGNPVINWRIGDPQWIGVLRNPRRPLSADNPFIARYAFMVLPAGRSLDVNWIHNDGKSDALPTPGGSWYSRNQGVGSYELNLAGFLNDLNTNVWSGYVYQIAQGNESTGVAFSDAWQVLNARYSFVKAGAPGVGLDKLGDHFPIPEARSLIEGQGVDLFGNRNFNFATIQNWPWPGSTSRRHIFGVNDYFSGNSILSIPPANRPGFLERLNNIGFNGNSYDRYSFYRMLAQLGTDSDEEEEGRININYVNVRGFRAAELVRWSDTSTTVLRTGLKGPELFFLTAITNLIAREPDLASFVTNRINGTVLSIPVFTNGSTYSTTPYSTTNRIRGPLYSARLHQLLQITANIYDATISNRVSAVNGSPHYPTIFRPWFHTEPDGNVYITNYTLMDQSAAVFLAKRWVDLDTGESLASIDDLVYGVPLIVGARSGLPSFNELGVVSTAQATRKLTMARSSSAGLTPTRPWNRLDQQFNLQVRTMLQVEARNPNTKRYPNLLQIIVRSRPFIDLKERTNGPSIVRTDWTTGSTNNFTPAQWGAEVIGSENPNNTNLVVSPLFVTNLLDLVVITNAESITGSNQWTLALTNRLLFYLIDGDISVAPGGRIIDVVSFNRPHNVFEIGNELEKEVDGGGSIKDIWSSRREGTVTEGIMEQIRVSQSGNVPDSVWGNWEDSANKDKSVLKFRDFYTDTSKLETNQVPFTPSRVLVQSAYYQVDDPLVHYTFQDLRDDPNTDKKKTGTVPLFSDYTNLTVKMFGQNTHSKPWNKGSFAPDVELPGQGTLDPTIRDPGLLHPSLWNFPTNLFPSVGWLGRVHRGTPWQTIYLKSRPLFQPENWIDHTGNQRGYDPNQAYAVGLLQPQRDWELFDVFTTAPHPNATRGRLSVNQTNQAAWSALLTGIQASVPVDDDGWAIATNETIQPFGVAPALIPDAVPKITQSLNTNRTLFGFPTFNPHRQFRHLGQILAAPALSDASPFLLSNPALFDPFAPAGNARIYDEDYERIPQQILSLLKVGEPKFVVYAWGQSLKPARAGVPLDGSGRIARSQPLSGPSINVSGDRLVNNYQITGEMATKAVVRVVFPERLANGEINYQKPKLVVEGFNVIDVE